MQPTPTSLAALLRGLVELPEGGPEVTGLALDSGWAVGKPNYTSGGPTNA